MLSIIALRLFLANYKGDADAQLLMAESYRKGEGVEKNYDEAYRLYKLAAAQKHHDALYELAKLYRDGLGSVIPRSSPDILDCLTQAAELDHTEAKLDLARIYRDGSENIPPNPDLAIKWFTKVNASGCNLEAHNSLVELHGIDGHIEPGSFAELCFYRSAQQRGIEQAAAEIEKLYARVSGETLYNWALNFLEGKNGVQKDIDLALKLLELAGDNGHANAYLQLGCLYYDGDEVTKDMVQSESWYKKSLAKGCFDSLNYLGSIYYSKREYKTALEYLERAITKGDNAAMRNKGLLYKFGYGGLKKNLSDAFDWYHKAQLKGYDCQKDFDSLYDSFKELNNSEHQQARLQLAEMYIKGDLIKRDYQKAIDLLKPLAKQDVAEAEFLLARVYSKITVDFPGHDTVFNLYRSAATKGHSEAQRKTANRYLKGKGVEQKTETGMHWLRQAVAKDNEKAIAKLAELSKPGRQQVDKPIAKAKMD